MPGDSHSTSSSSSSSSPPPEVGGSAQSHGTDGERAVGTRDSLVAVYLKGAAMGAADTVPGVSGGTIALITGVYERFVRALTALSPGVLRHLPRLHRAEGRRALRTDLRGMDVFFLAALGLGVVSAVVTLSRVVHVALSGYPALTFAFFFGLIGASAVVLYDAVSIERVGHGVAAVAGFGVAFVVAGASASAGGALGHGLPVLFGAGAVGITAMVLPGISGSFILLLLGQYAYMTGVLTRFVDGTLAALTGGSFARVTEPASAVAVFCAGAAVGLFTVAHLIRRALDRYRAATLAFLVSLMLGSLRLPAVRVLGGVDRWTPGTAGAVVLVGAVGAGAVLVLDRVTGDLSY